MIIMQRKLKYQAVIAALLMVALIFPIASAQADTTITIQGVIDPATIDISVSKAVLDLDIAAGTTSASDTITIDSTAQIPVAVKLVSFTQSAETWEPTLITDNPTTLGISDAQTKAKVSIEIDTADPDYLSTPGYQALVPTGTGSTVSSYNGSTYTGTSYPASLGVITDSDGVDSKSIDITTTLETNKKRILSKAFEADMVLNFSAVED